MSQPNVVIVTVLQALSNLLSFLLEISKKSNNICIKYYWFKPEIEEFILQGGGDYNTWQLFDRLVL